MSVYSWMVKKRWYRSSRCGSAVMNLTSIHEDVGSIPGLSQWDKGSCIAMSCSICCRHGSDLALLWLWCRLGTGALIPPLAWEFPCAACVALKEKKNTTCGHEVSLYNEMLLRCKKEWNNAICSNMDATRNFHTECSKSEREWQITHYVT